MKLLISNCRYRSVYVKSGEDCVDKTFVLYILDNTNIYIYIFILLQAGIKWLFHIHN
jgi:hypothetical protein